MCFISVSRGIYAKTFLVFFSRGKKEKNKRKQNVFFKYQPIEIFFLTIFWIFQAHGKPNTKDRQRISEQEINTVENNLPWENQCHLLNSEIKKRDDVKQRIDKRIEENLHILFAVIYYTKLLLQNRKRQI